ncbi:MAG: hypothetical protein QXR51_04820 [Desulfurococcaceae archaeon]
MKISAVKVTTTSISRSFFAKLSRYSQTPIYLFVHRYWREPIYLAVAYTDAVLEPDKLKSSYQSEKTSSLKWRDYRIPLRHICLLSRKDVNSTRLLKNTM